VKGRTPLFYVGLAILGLVAVVAVLAPLLSPYDPSAVSGDSLESPSAKHLLGTNDIGQDIFSQLVSGTRSSIIVAVAAASLAMAVALLVGIGAGLLGGMVDTVTMRVIDLLLAIPTLPLLILVAALAGPSRVTVVLIIGLFGWPDIARTLRAQTLSLRQRGYVHLARGLGGGPLYVMRRHLVAALGPLIVANFVGRAGVAIFLDAGLAFLGLSDPTAVSWGQVLFRALNYRGLYYSPLWTWWVLPAGLAVTTVVLGFTFVGVGLETRMNPRAARRS
jgi:peptide/nickel transport system permease protein